MPIEPTLATTLYGAARKATSALPDPGDDAPGVSFSQALTDAAKTMQTTLRNGEQAAEAAMSGKGDVQSLAMALSQTQLALETTVTIRDKVVSAYQDILRMPV